MGEVLSKIHKEKTNEAKIQGENESKALLTGEVVECLHGWQGQKEICDDYDSFSRFSCLYESVDFLKFRALNVQIRVHFEQTFLHSLRPCLLLLNMVSANEEVVLLVGSRRECGVEEHKLAGKVQYSSFSDFSSGLDVRGLTAPRPMSRRERVLYFCIAASPKRLRPRRMSWKALLYSIINHKPPSTNSRVSTSAMGGTSTVPSSICA